MELQSRVGYFLCSHYNKLMRMKFMYSKKEIPAPEIWHEDLVVY